jgi:hypothetical protein
MLRFFLILFLSLLVPVSYAVVPRFFPGTSTEELWGGVHKLPTRILYLISIGLAAVSYLVLLSFYYHRSDSDALFYAFLGFLFFSMLWMPLMYLSLENPSPGSKAAMVVTLALVAAFSCWILAVVQGDQPRWWESTAAAYLMLHSVFVDGVVFSVSYFYPAVL